MAKSISCDDAVQATNDDAVCDKCCAVRLGYWNDPYLSYFNHSLKRKPPEMNRGYYARTISIKLIVEKMIKLTNGECQIVNLGAGFDTLFWKLKDDRLKVLNYTEVDFPSVTARKVTNIKRTKLLLQRLADNDETIKIDNSDLHSSGYHIVGVDIRNLFEVQKKLRESEVDFTVPTLFLAECVLIYVDTSSSDALLKWITESFVSCVFLNYEQLNMDDRFGQVMVENFKLRGCMLSGIQACRNKKTQEDRFLKSGWETAKIVDMMQVYHSLPVEDVTRIEKLEFLDERELLEQLFAHYCLCIATKDGHQLGFSKLDL